LREILPEKRLQLTGLLTGEIFGKILAEKGARKRAMATGIFRREFPPAFFQEKFREKMTKISAEKAWSVTGRMAARFSKDFRVELSPPSCSEIG